MDRFRLADREFLDPAAGIGRHQIPVHGPAEQGGEILAVEIVVVVGGAGEKVLGHQVAGEIFKGEIAGEIPEGLIDVPLIFPGLGLKLAPGLGKVIKDQRVEIPARRRGAAGRPGF